MVLLFLFLLQFLYLWIKMLSRTWSHPVVLNQGPLDWESSAITNRLLLHMTRWGGVSSHQSKYEQIPPSNVTCPPSESPPPLPPHTHNKFFFPPDKVVVPSNCETWNGALSLLKFLKKVIKVLKKLRSISKGTFKNLSLSYAFLQELIIHPH